MRVVRVSTVQEHGQVHRLLGKPMTCDQLIQSSLVALKTWLPTHKQKQVKKQHYLNDVIEAHATVLN